MSEQWTCPACGVPCPWPPAGTCSGCGAPLDSPLVADLVEVDRRLADLQARRRELVGGLRAAAVPVGAGALPAAPAPAAQPPPASPAAAQRMPTSRATRGLRGTSAQTLLAVCGAALLALAGVVFLAVTWARLSATAQAALLAGATLAAGVAAQRLRRRDLVSTAEAVGALAAVLALVTVHGGRAEGAAGLDAVPFDTYLAVTGALLAPGLVAWSRWAGARAGQVAAVGVAALAVVATPAALVAHAGMPFEAAPLVLGAVLAVVFEGRRALEGRLARRLAAGAAGLVAAGAWGSALVVVVDSPTAVDVVWALAAAALLAGWLWTRPGAPAAAAASWVASTVPAAAAVIAAVDLLEGIPPGVAAGVVGLCAAVAVVALPDRRDAAAAGAAAVPLLVGVHAALPLIRAVGQDLARVLPDGVWTRPGAGTHLDWWVPLVALALATVAGALLTWRRDGHPASHMGARAVLALGGIGLVVGGAALVGGGWWTQAALGAAVLLAAAAATVRAVRAAPTAPRQAGATRSPVRGTSALRAAVPSEPAVPSQPAAWHGLAAAAGGAWLLLWSLGDRWATVAALAGVAATGALVVAAVDGLRASEAPRLRAAAACWTAAAVGGALALPMTALGAAGAERATVAVAGGATVALAGLGVGPWHRPGRPTDVAHAGEALTALTLVVAALLAPTRATLAVVAYLGAVGATGNGLVSARLWPVHAGAALASAGTALLLAVRDVGVVEAYAAVPVAATLAVGLWRLARDPALGTVRALRVPLALGLGPTAAQVLADPTDLTRVLALTCAALFLGAAGGWLRWAAPVLGAGASVAVVVATQGWVVAEALPRWVVFAVAGLALIVVSATWERQLRRLAALRDRAERLR